MLNNAFLWFTFYFLEALSTNFNTNICFISSKTAFIILYQTVLDRSEKYGINYLIVDPSLSVITTSSFPFLNTNRIFST